MTGASHALQGSGPSGSRARIAGTGGAAIASPDGLVGTAVITNAPTTASNANTYALTYASGLSATNYNFNGAAAPVNYVVSPVQLVVTGANNSTVYTGAVQSNSGASATVNGSGVIITGNTIATGVAKTIGAASQAPSAIRSAANTVTTGAAKGISKAVGAASQAPSAVKQALDRAKQSFHSKPPEPTKAPKMQMRNMTSSYDHSDLLDALDQLDEATLDAYIDSLTDSEFELLEMMVNEVSDKK